MNILEAVQLARNQHELLASSLDEHRDVIFALRAAKPQTVDDIPVNCHGLLLVCLQLAAAELQIRFGSQLLEEGQRELVFIGDNDS
ncbi:MAG: hypothetical protein CMJ47_02850 [Planctomyces sp.]|nr:hypothetical protein [Planctomyces sp.]